MNKILIVSLLECLQMYVIFKHTCQNKCLLNCIISSPFRYFGSDLNLHFMEALFRFYSNFSVSSGTVLPALFRHSSVSHSVSVVLKFESNHYFIQTFHYVRVSFLLKFIMKWYIIWQETEKQDVAWSKSVGLAYITSTCIKFYMQSVNSRIITGIYVP